MRRFLWLGNEDGPSSDRDAPDNIAEVSPNMLALPCKVLIFRNLCGTSQDSLEKRARQRRSSRTIGHQIPVAMHVSGSGTGVS